MALNRISARRKARAPGKQQQRTERSTSDRLDDLFQCDTFSITRRAAELIEQFFETGYFL